MCVFCTPCKCGYPFWPLPCCWWCAPGCSTMCGTCGGPAEGEGAAMVMPSMLKLFMKAHGFNGPGLLPPDAQEMVRDEKGKFI